MLKDSLRNVKGRSFHCLLCVIHKTFHGSCEMTLLIVSNTNLLANESVSGFLNAAVNQIAADLIKGVDIDINLKTVDDDPSAVRTDLNIMLGKSFLNDRFMSLISFSRAT